MGIRIVRLGSERAEGEGVRIGTVRRPPRGIPKAEFSRRNYYDVWLPNLAPSVDLMAQAKAAATEKEWGRFVRKFRQELDEREAGKVLDVFAALSRTTHFSIGCYCEDENRCHRAVLRALLEERGADIL